MGVKLGLGAKQRRITATANKDARTEEIVVFTGEWGFSPFAFYDS